MVSESAPTPWLRNIVIGLLATIALGTRLPAPWQTEIINDEIFHIKSWRNRYRTDDVLPLFLRRLDQTDQLSQSQKAYLKDLYHSSPLFQRLLCVKSDYASVGYSALAEAIEAISKSNLIALRVPSVLFSLGTILLAYFLGKLLSDELLGLWLAAFFAMGLIAEVYAGIGRPHAMSQLATVAVIYMFSREQRFQYRSPWRFLVVALLGQTAHLICWAVIGIFVLSELARRYMSGTRLLELARQTWWYAALSIVLLGLFFVFSFGTSVIGANVYYPGMKAWWSNICLASPFGHLAIWGGGWEWVSGLTWVALILNGLRILFVEEWGRGFRWPFLITVLVSLCVPLVASSGFRHMMIYGVILTVLSAIGARGLFRTPRAAMVSLAVLLSIFTVISLTCRDCAYQLQKSSEVRYSRVAELLAGEMKPGDIWINWPYFLGCPLYPYRDPYRDPYRALPEPTMALTRDEFREALHKRPPDHACFVLVAASDENADPALKQASWRVAYPNGMILLKLPRQSPPP